LVKLRGFLALCRVYISKINCDGKVAFKNGCRWNECRANKSVPFVPNALNKAMTREGLGLSPYTGFDHNKAPIVRMELPGAGRGYRSNKKDNNSPTLNEDLNWFEVKFDKQDKTRPFTNFPTERK
jgi:hypothetical protein